jgi:hypothetical protein
MKGIVIDHIKEQTRSHVSNDPVELFLSYLVDALLSRQCHISNLNGDAPYEQPLAWGWTERTFRVASSSNVSPSPDGKPTVGAEEPEEKTYHTSNGIRVGFTDGVNLYLLPGAALEAAQKIADRCGQYLPFTSRSLGKKLHENGLLRSIDDNRGKYTIRKSILDGRLNVLHLSAESLIRAPFNGPIWEEADWEGPNLEELLPKDDLDA